MEDTFTITSEQLAQACDLNDAIEGLAEEGFNFLISLGLSPRDAGSVVANIMLKHAWALAGAGKILSGAGEPDPEMFINAARAQIGTVRFTLTPEQVEAN